MIKSLLELLSDEVSRKLSSCALNVLLDVVECSRSGPTKAMEVCIVDVLVELLAEADDRRDAEQILLLLKPLCKCPEGCLAFAEHNLSVTQAMADSSPLLPSKPARQRRVEPATAEASQPTASSTSCPHSASAQSMWSQAASEPSRTGALPWHSAASATARIIVTNMAPFRPFRVILVID